MIVTGTAPVTGVTPNTTLDYRAIGHISDYWTDIGQRV